MTITFDGYSLRSYVGKINDIRRPIMPKRDHSLVDIPGMAGAIIARSKSGVKIIEVDVQIFGNTKTEIRTKVEALAAVLFTEAPAPMVFDDDPNKTYYAIVMDDTAFDELARIGKSTIKFLCPDPYPIGQAVTRTTATGTDKTDFANKIRYSLIENPHIAKYRGSTALSTPSQFTTEYPQSYYDRVETQNLSSQSYTYTAGATPNIPQMLFSFNMIEYIKREFGDIPGTTAQKIAWMKLALSSISTEIWAWGSGPAGNKVTVNIWSTSLSWVLVGSNSAAIPTKITDTRTINASSTTIDANGWMHFIVYADAVSSTVASTVAVDYIAPTFTFNENYLMKLTNAGNAPTLPIFTVTFGVAATYYVIRNSKGQQMKIEFNFAVGDELIIDHVQNLILINGTENNATVTLDSDFFALAPGENGLLFGTDATTQPVVSVGYTERWLS